MEHISPELALVDPVIATAARARLPDPPDCLARRPPTAPVEAGAAEPEQRQRHRFLRAVGTTAAWVVICAVVTSPLLAFLPPKASSRPQIVENGDDPAFAEPAVTEGSFAPTSTPVTILPATSTEGRPCAPRISPAGSSVPLNVPPGAVFDPTCGSGVRPGAPG